MEEDRGRQIMLAFFLAALAVLTWTEIKRSKVVPRPQRYVGAGLTWGILGVAAPIISYRVAATLSAGLFLALLYAYFDVRVEQKVIQQFGSNAITTSFAMASGD